MLNYTDIIKNSFIQQYVNSEIDTIRILITLVVATVLGSYLFFVYRSITKKSFFSKAFAISLVVLPIITGGIILAMQSNLVISLGMVGALSIVRFRTAIKEPMDLLFLFWAISIGIICGAGLYEIGIIVSVFVTVALCVFERIPVSKASMLLVLKARNLECEEKIMSVIKSECKFFSVKTRNVMQDKVDMIIEVKLNNEMELIKKILEIENVEKVSLLSHDGDVAF